MPDIDADDEPDDPRLMANLAAGDDHALDLLMDRWKSRLTAFLSRMTGDSTVAVDLAQETFVKLYFSSGRYKPTGKFPTFLFTIAANLARNHFRFRARHPTVSLDQPAGDVLSPAPVAVDASLRPDQHALASEREREILTAIAALPDDQREAVALSLHEDLGTKEIAAIMGCSPKAVDNKLFLGRRRLRERLAHLVP